MPADRPTPVGAAVLHRAINAAWKPIMVERGYRRLEGSRAHWYKPLDLCVLVVEVISETLGPDPSSGHDFSVSLRVAELPDSIERSGDRRLIWFLNPKGREEVRALNNRIIGELPEPDPAYLALYLQQAARSGGGMSSYLHTYRQLRSKPYQPNDYISLKYFSKEHAQEWARLLARALPDMLDKLAQLSQA